MSLILVRTSQEYTEEGVFSFDGSFKGYAFAIDVASMPPLKQKIIRTQVLQVLENLKEEHPKLVGRILSHDIDYPQGCVYAIDFASPMINLEKMGRYQHFIQLELQDFHPVFVDEGMMEKIHRCTVHLAHNIPPKVSMDDIEETIFGVQRQRALIRENIQVSPEKESASVSPKKI